MDFRSHFEHEALLGGHDIFEFPDPSRKPLGVLSALGPVSAILDPVPRATSLLISIALYAASARLFQRTVWHHLTSWLAVVWLLLAVNLVPARPSMTVYATVLTLVAPAFR